jgi:hypothetical protein
VAGGLIKEEEEGTQSQNQDRLFQESELKMGKYIRTIKNRTLKSTDTMGRSYQNW